MADNPMFAQRFGSQSIAEEDPEVYEAMQREAARQHRKLELIASENYTSRAVLQATGSIL